MLTRLKIFSAAAISFLMASCGGSDSLGSGDAVLSVARDMSYSLSVGGRDFHFSDRLFTDNGSFGSFCLEEKELEKTLRGERLRCSGTSSETLMGGGYSKVL